MLLPTVLRSCGEQNTFVNGYECVDLGLSVCWATCNVGANDIYDEGEFIAWGEMKSKSEYSWESYKFFYNSRASLSKYSEGTAYTLEPADDAAHVRWGGTWRMPSANEWQELIENCTWTYVDEDNQAPYFKVQSKKRGYTNRWIILPPAVSRGEEIVGGDGSMGEYWSSSSADDGSSSYAVMFYEGSESVNLYDRYYGMPIRPVCTK